MQYCSVLCKRMHLFFFIANLPNVCGDISLCKWFLYFYLCFFVFIVCNWHVLLS